MTESFKIGDRVKIRLRDEEWFNGHIVRIDPYSAHRSFYWVELDDPTQAGMKLISIFNPRNIQAV